MNAVTLLSMLLSAVASGVLAAYPVFGTKRYGRSSGAAPHRVSGWGLPAPLPLQAYQQPHTQNHFGYPPAYYSPEPPVVGYPYATAQDYVDSDYYYPQEPLPYAGYPGYYPAGGSVKYAAVYQSAPPYYYADGRRYPYYGYEETGDPVDDLQEEMEAEEREERGETLPVGQETWFEGQQPDSLADANAVFLQNLILSQMYNDGHLGYTHHPAAPHPASYSEDDMNDDAWMYGDVVRSRGDGYYGGEEDMDDEDVKELKSLVKKTRDAWSEGGNVAESAQMWQQTARSGNKKSRDPLWFQMDSPARYGSGWAAKRDHVSAVPISLSDRKPHNMILGARGVPATATTTSSSTSTTTTTMVPPPATTTPSPSSHRGQKEIPLLRPANTPRRAPIITRSRTSVYDTIKQLLAMEKELRKGAADSSQHSRHQKRFVSNEETLVEELSHLKKHSV